MFGDMEGNQKDLQYKYVYNPSNVNFNMYSVNIIMFSGACLN